MSFTQISLTDVATISAGFPLRGAVDDLAAGEVAMIQMRNVDPDGGIDWVGVRRVTLPAARSASLLASGDVIFTTRGTRNFAVALAEIPGLGVCSPHFFVIRPTDPARLAPDFLAWQINQRPAQEYFRREATGSYILNIRRDVVENLAIVVPPMARQHAIVAFARTARTERAALARLIDNRNLQIEAIALDLHRPERSKS
jgi:hypothetical protein